MKKLKEINWPDDLEDVCLHEFVANYNWYGKDSKEERKYSKLGKLGWLITRSLILKRKARTSVKAISEARQADNVQEWSSKRTMILSCLEKPTPQ